MTKSRITSSTLLRIVIVSIAVSSLGSIYLSGIIGLRCSSSIDYVAVDYDHHRRHRYNKYNYDDVRDDRQTGRRAHPNNNKRRREERRVKSKKRKPVSEIYVISLLESKANIFRHRNFDLEDDIDDDDIDNYIEEVDDDNDDGFMSSTESATNIEWFRSYDGMNQTTLKEWSQITGLYELKASDFANMTDLQRRKDAYASPHSVGCYLSHWRLLEKVWQQWRRRIGTGTRGSRGRKRRKQRKPDMLFVFEDDAHCVSNSIDRTWDVVQTLPEDWDILYLGGKPVSYYTMNRSLNGYINMETPTTEAGTWKDDSFRPTDEKLLSDMCKGKYGKSASGPFPVYSFSSSSSSSSSSAKQQQQQQQPSYYEVKNVLNTHAYVVNPKRISRILRVLSKPMNEYKPIDVILADDMFREFMDPYGMLKSNNDSTTSSSSSSSHPLKAYLTPFTYCDQDIKRVIINRDDPILPHWEGYYWLPWRLHKGFPDGTGYVWGKMGTGPGTPCHVGH